MYTNIPKKAKTRNSFSPVRVPKTKDIFNRLGYRKMNHQDGEVADFSRNPMEAFDRDTRIMNQMAYEDYRASVEKEQSVNNKPDEDTTDETSKARAI